MYAIFSIHSTNPYYNVYIVALSFNLCVGKLEPKKAIVCCVPNYLKKKEIVLKPKDVYPEASTRDVIVSENTLREGRSHHRRLPHTLICLVQ